MNSPNTHQKRPLTVQDLPHEILMVIFSFLDVNSLVSAKQCCSAWYSLLSKDVSWRTAFQYHFSGDQNQYFSPVGNGTWRQEYILRMALQIAYKRGKGQTMQYDSRVGQMTHIYCDFGSNRLFTGNLMTGCVSISDPKTGKVERGLLHCGSGELSTTHTVSKMMLGRQLMGFGFLNGQVGAIIMTRAVANQRKFRAFSEKHEDAVSCIDVVRGDLPPLGQIGIVTGGDDGCVRCWDARTGVCLQSFRFDSSQIVSVNYNSRRRLLMFDVYNYSKGFYALYIVEGPSILTPLVKPRLIALRVCQLNEADEPLPMLCVDCSNKCAFVTTGAPLNCIERFSYDTQDELAISSSTPLESRVLYECQGKPTYMVIDANEREPKNFCPGENARLVAVGDDAGRAYLINSQASSSRRGFLKTMEVSRNTPVTCLALNNAVLVAGAGSGFCGIFDTVTGTLLRTIANARNPARREPILCISIDSDSLSPKGAISMGKHVKSWAYTMPKQLVIRRPRTVNPRSANIPPSLPMQRGGAEYSKNELEREILMGLDQVAQERRERLEAKEQAQQLLGAGLVGLSDEELLAYATMLSREEAERQELQAQEMQTILAEETTAENAPGNSTQESSAPILETPTSVTASSPPIVPENYMDLDEEEQIRLAMQLSLLDMN
ncbi:F-box protein Pof10 [Schizosaccharomyces japonicus yFS275]|uniref:F-box protein Pof10 n=1 Tax=Schizosaccharomyces japonicus (strain yFS275 / FY16936) TaxID=402676 RepID=B6JYF5_SCHJY|nr:F-box protein Pof10 [Schizosaccharomyces japonicus yFS275]EEB06573.1 F-box protein Pof10 [Schizosaccharomyces japonicus yFS275]